MAGVSRVSPVSFLKANPRMEMILPLIVLNLPVTVHNKFTLSHYYEHLLWLEGYPEYQLHQSLYRYGLIYPDE